MVVLVSRLLPIVTLLCNEHLGAYAVHNSHYGKPDRAIHYSYVLCDGDESAITSCGKITHTLTEGRSIFLEAVVAGVVCRYAPNDTKPIEMCVSIPEETKDNCKDGDLNVDERSGTMQYCTNGVWSSICSTLTHNETTVACRQLGYTTFTCEFIYRKMNPINAPCYVAS